MRRQQWHVVELHALGARARNHRVQALRPFLPVRRQVAVRMGQHDHVGARGRVRAQRELHALRRGEGAGGATC